MDTNTALDRMTAALQAWDGSTRIWRPTSTDDDAYRPKYVLGELLRVEEWDTQHGMAHVAIISEDTDAQETAVFLSSMALTKLWEAQAPSVGDRVGFAYGGRGETRNGNVYNRYKLVVERCGVLRAPCAVEPGAQGDPFEDQ